MTETIETRQTLKEILECLKRLEEYLCASSASMTGADTLSEDLHTKSVSGAASVSCTGVTYNKLGRVKHRK